MLRVEPRVEGILAGIGTAWPAASLGAMRTPTNDAGSSVGRTYGGHDLPETVDRRSHEYARAPPWRTWVTATAPPGSSAAAGSVQEVAAAVRWTDRRPGGAARTSVRTVSASCGSPSWVLTACTRRGGLP